MLLWYREKRMTKRQRMKPSWWQPHYEGFYYAQMSNPTWVCCGCGSCVNPTRYVVFNMAMLPPHTNVENVETEVGMWDTEK